MKFKVQFVIFLAVILTLALLTPAGAYVTPKLGGAQLGMDVMPMIMPEITIVGTNIVVLDEAGNDWVTFTGDSRPVLRPLVPPDAFDPAATWYNALNGKAYNWQYGWANDALNQSLIPVGSKIWIEVLDQSPGLHTYDRSTNNNYSPIFTTNGSIWLWPETKSMSHNAMTVTPGFRDDLFATYKIYIGDAVTKVPLEGYGSDTVTLTWTSIPEPATLGLMAAGIAYLLRRKH